MTDRKKDVPAIDSTDTSSGKRQGKGNAWQINDRPEPAHDRSGCAEEAEDHGHAWQINENTAEDSDKSS